MAKSYRRTRIYVDSFALTRLMEVSKKTDLYDSRREADEDDYEAIIKLLCDRFEDESGECDL